ncbi:BA3454 family stress response protein [Mesobacillus harenae]|nr:BA3454 family stress response protein [Mesobacillus harenae]
MVEVTVVVNFSGRSYRTNVIAPREASKDEIMRQAHQQVRKQWISYI